MNDLACPPKDLVIYCLQGKVPRDCFQNDPTFLGNWEEDGQAFLFFSGSTGSDREDVLSKHPHLRLKDRFQTSYEAWQGSPVRPFREDRLLVVPAWDELPEQGQEDLLIRLDPGVVFGAGNHPTTRDCLQALVRVFSLADQQGETLRTALDLGAGSGLLSLAAARLGSDRVLALDLNPLAASTCRRNVRLNRQEGTVLSIQGRAEDYVHTEADLLLANIHFEIMKTIVNSRFFLQKRWFILSGLLHSQVREIRVALKNLGSEVITAWDHDGTWFTLLGRNR